MLGGLGVWVGVEEEVEEGRGEEGLVLGFRLDGAGFGLDADVDDEDDEDLVRFVGRSSST
jgi:hypothetical protein